jgi:hypothetical protein
MRLIYGLLVLATLGNGIFAILTTNVSATFAWMVAFGLSIVCLLMAIYIKGIIKKK